MTRETTTPEQIAERFGLSTKTVYRALRSGELRGAKFGSRWSVLDVDADAWFDSKVPLAVDASPVPARPHLRRSRRAPSSQGGLRALIGETQGGRAA